MTDKNNKSHFLKINNDLDLKDKNWIIALTLKTTSAKVNFYFLKKFNLIKITCFLYLFLIVFFGNALTSKNILFEVRSEFISSTDQSMMSQPNLKVLVLKLSTH